MKKKTQAFTLAEALILLLIAALLAAALVPVITRKHKEVGEHGEWICTINNNGKHVVKTTYRGKVTEFLTAHAGGDYCVFSPPAAAKNFTIKAVGGGGGGAGGQKGATKSIYDSRTDEEGVFTGTIDTDGSYNVFIAGSGGGGGGMACGEAKYQSYINQDFNDKNLFFTESSDYHGGLNAGTKWIISGEYGYKRPSNPIHCEVLSDKGNVKCDIESPDSVPNPARYYEYGFVDKPIGDFDYNILKQNDKEYTDTPGLDHGRIDKKVVVYDANGNRVSSVSIYDAKYQYNYIKTDEGTTYDQLHKKAFCFAEKDWPLSKEVNGDKGLYLTDGVNPSIKCWNLPGMGGHAGATVKSLSNQKLSAGESIYVTVGHPGGESQATGPANKNVGAYLLDSSGNFVYQEKVGAFGGDGTDGDDTILHLGSAASETAAGGPGGAGRYLTKVHYINIPVHECRVEEEYFSSVSNNPSCNTSSWYDDSSVCNQEFCTLGQTDSDHFCTTGWEQETYTYDYACDSDGDGEKNETCTGTDTRTVCKGDTYPGYRCKLTGYNNGYHDEYRYNYDKATDCVVAIRSEYFKNTLDVNACIYSADIPDNPPKPPSKGKGGVMDLDFPYLLPEIKEYDPSEGSTDDSLELDYYTIVAAGRIKYIGQPGSGGYGAGELTKNYVKVNPDGTQSYADFTGSKGTEGYVVIVKSDAYGGTGGQAGQYVSTMVKKLEKLKITIGKPGAPGSIGMDGNSGGETIIAEYNNDKEMFVMQGGMGGQALKLMDMANASVVMGGDGAASPVENESNRAKIVPLGGYSSSEEQGTNNNMNGQTAAISNIWGKSSGMSKSAFNGYEGSGSSVGLVNLIGGNPLDMTYGAGGGGGAGSESTAGIGGAGTPGAVIIKW